MEVSLDIVDFDVELDNYLEEQWQHLTDIPPQRKLEAPLVVTTVVSPNRRKVDYTAQFRYEFQLLIHENKQAKRKWESIKKKYKGYCSNKRCIKLMLAFCNLFGNNLEELSKKPNFKKLGSRSTCTCSSSSPISPCSSPSPSLSPQSVLPPITPMSPFFSLDEEIFPTLDIFQFNLD